MLLYVAEMSCGQNTSPQHYGVIHSPTLLAHILSKVCTLSFLPDFFFGVQKDMAFEVLSVFIILSLLMPVTSIV